MTPDEKQLIIDLFDKFHYIFYKVKVLDDIIQRILDKQPEIISAELHAKIEETNANIAQVQLKGFEDRIKAITV